MRAIGTLLAVLGACWLALPWWPESIAATLPPIVHRGSLVGGALLAFVGIGLRFTGRRRRTRGGDDSAARLLLAGRGLHLSGPAQAWQASGAWGDVPVLVRRDESQAGRFGRVWILLVEVAGKPRQPWSLPPGEARLLESDEERFVVAVPDAMRLDGDALSARIDQVVAARR